MIQENIAKLKTHNMVDELDDKTDLTYGQLFQLVKNLGFLTSNSLSVGISGRVIGSATPFTEDGISSVDINASGLVMIYWIELLLGEKSEVLNGNNECVTQTHILVLC